ncbi:MAG: NADH-quinone oxidoreductase subunit [Pyrinomonadaceae bacterium]|nr:NADH-quinone oxidoreductase subunit [Pyrinomonadaceae bacterium]MDX6271196.1 NADH-quinone oxidoreductase subunit [Acidobacteriota bacterium]
MLSLILLQAANAATDATAAAAANAPATTTTTAAATQIGSPVTAYWPVMIFFAFAVVFPVLPIVLGRLLRPSVWQKDKMRPYECGIDPTTEAHDRFTVRYYIVAMLFLVFDVETIFLLPWAIIFMGDDFSFTKFALIEMLVFIGILVLGYYYAWRKGALEWA